jgi:DNA replication and repair protein RecF
VQLGEALSVLRGRYFDDLRAAFLELVQELLPELNAVCCEFRPGWDTQLSLAEAMERVRESEIARGFTQTGPQRADIRLSVDGHAAADTLSRGQQKLMACALKLAQGQRFADAAGGARSCLYLIDDLPAELDVGHLALVCGRLAAMRAQVFITTIDPTPVLRAWPAGPGVIGMFHVEHGTVTASPPDAALSEADST